MLSTKRMRFQYQV
ncbi:Protein of unknown function [Bacillus cytotoxicus]|uniref:Uncharacterized protein n=1 Tax=Bacillus cytotoxicus TaxID=580165 RepID=A0AAX2CCB3_9BACI|nr:Protein of unknown function [Bacillus cytotoxicus]